MTEKYEMYLDTSGRIQVRDLTQDMPENIAARLQGSWKKLFTLSMRRRNRIHTNKDLFTRPGVYCLSYPKGPCILADPSKGDYIPPGFLYYSYKLDASNLRGIDFVRKFIHRSNVIPVEGYVFNPDLKGMQRSGDYNIPIYVYRNDRHHSGQLTGWTFSKAGRGYSMTVRLSSSEGVCAHRGSNSNDDDLVVMSQDISGQVLGGKTRLRVRVEGSVGVVMIDANVLTRDPEDPNIFVWEGEPLSDKNKTKLSVTLTTSPLRRVEILDD